MRTTVRTTVIALLLLAVASPFALADDDSCPPYDPALSVYDTDGDGAFTVIDMYANYESPDPWDFYNFVYLIFYPGLFRSGDVNDDGVTDVVDVVWVARCPQAGLYFEQADMNLDGAVDQADVDIVIEVSLWWLANG